MGSRLRRQRPTTRSGYTRRPVQRGSLKGISHTVEGLLHSDPFGGCNLFAVLFTGKFQIQYTVVIIGLDSFFLHIFGQCEAPGERREAVLLTGVFFIFFFLFFFFSELIVSMLPSTSILKSSFFKPGAASATFG